MTPNCPICRAKMREFEGRVDDVFPMPLLQDELIESLENANSLLYRAINDSHFYMSRDGNAFKAFQILDDMVKLMGDSYS